MSSASCDDGYARILWQTIVGYEGGTESVTTGDVFIAGSGSNDNGVNFFATGSGAGNDGGFKLSEEAQLISKNFNANKGRLPSPVIRGNVVLGFGKQPHPIVKTATIQSNGVRIRTSSDVEARSIFDGEVYSIIVSKNNSRTVLIQHGNFFTVYKNLSQTYVSKGDKLKTKEVIGKIATDPLNGQTILSFSIFYNGVPQNPRTWIYKL